MLIIFEGPDGCGKTTLAELLSAKLNFPIYRQGRPKVDGETGWHNIYVDRQKNFINLHKILDLNLILDRWHVSEMVYARYANAIFGGGRRIVDKSFDSAVADAYKDSILITTTAAYPIVCERAQKRDGKPYEFTEKQFYFIDNEFHRLSETLPFKGTIEIHTDTGLTPEQLLPWILEQLERFNK